MSSIRDQKSRLRTLAVVIACALVPALGSCGETTTSVAGSYSVDIPKTLESIDFAADGIHVTREVAGVAKAYATMKMSVVLVMKPDGSFTWVGDGAPGSKLSRWDVRGSWTLDREKVSLVGRDVGGVSVSVRGSFEGGELVLGGDNRHYVMKRNTE